MRVAFVERFAFQGASLVIPGYKEKELIDAVIDFDQHETRPQAAILIAFRHTSPQGVLDVRKSFLILSIMTTNFWAFEVPHHCALRL